MWAHNRGWAEGDVCTRERKNAVHVAVFCNIIAAQPQAALQQQETTSNITAANTTAVKLCPFPALVGTHW